MRGRFHWRSALAVENLGMQGRGDPEVVLTDAAALCGDHGPSAPLVTGAVLHAPVPALLAEPRNSPLQRSTRRPAAPLSEGATSGGKLHVISGSAVYARIGDASVPGLHELHAAASVVAVRVDALGHGWGLEVIERGEELHGFPVFANQVLQ